MRIFFGLLLLITSVSFVSAQQPSANKLIKKEVKDLTKTYKLDKRQIKTARLIQAEYHEFLAEIKDLQRKQPEIYYQKKKAIREHAEAKFRKIFRDNQLSILHHQIETRDQAVKQIWQSASKEELVEKKMYEELSALF